MKNPVCRRKFLAVSAATTMLGLTRHAWAAEPAGALATVSKSIFGLNDYCVAELSSSALKHNLSLVRNALKPTTKFCAVVKANCYGHHWSDCKDVISPMADWLAVATPVEAIAMRRSGWKKPILLLMASGFSGKTARKRLQQLIANDITLTITAPVDIEVASAVASELGRTAKAHIMIDTGMTRSGIRHDRAPDLIHHACKQPGMALTGLYTHYPLADAADKTFTREQLARFLAAVRLSGDDAKGLLLHSAASAATIDLPETHLDMVRVGTASYGYQPSDEMHNHLPLRPILRIVSRLTQVKEVAAGSRVGYGLTYRFVKSGRVGLVPIGYADGYCRSFSNRAVMRIGDRFVPVRGRVSMDQTIIDLTELPEAKVGDPVEIVSSDPKAPNSVNNLARVANTIPQVITCGFGARIRHIVTARPL